MILERTNAHTVTPLSSSLVCAKSKPNGSRSSFILLRSVSHSWSNASMSCLFVASASISKSANSYKGRKEGKYALPTASTQALKSAFATRSDITRRERTPCKNNLYTSFECTLEETMSGRFLVSRGEKQQTAFFRKWSGRVSTRSFITARQYPERTFDYEALCMLFYIPRVEYVPGSHSFLISLKESKVEITRQYEIHFLLTYVSVQR